MATLYCARLLVLGGRITKSAPGSLKYRHNLFSTCLNPSSLVNRAVKRCYHSVKKDTTFSCDIQHTQYRTLTNLAESRQRSPFLLNKSYQLLLVRHGSGGGEEDWKKNSVLYMVSFMIIMGGLAYASVPLYKMFCRVSTKVTWINNIYACELIQCNTLFFTYFVIYPLDLLTLYNVSCISICTDFVKLH